MSLWIPIIIGFMNYWMIYADEPISTKSALRQFIFTKDWHNLLVLCQDYHNSVKSQNALRCEVSHDLATDCMAQQKTVKEWFLSPMNFC
jgi:hypothetical protein